MFLTRYPTSTYNQLRREMDDLFSGVFGDMFDGWRSAPGFPAVNLWEDAECLYAEAELPGMSMEDVEVFVTGDELHVKGCRKAPRDEGLTYHRRERGTGEFSRVVTLPYEVNADKVDATLKDGVLMIVLPKAESARPRKITVKSA